MSYKESKKRGSFDFPLAYYHLNTSHPRYVMDCHWHFENELIRVLEGELLVTLYQTKVLAKKGDIIFVNSSILHSAIPKNCIYECIVFDMGFLARENKACQSYVDQLTNITILVSQHICPKKNPKLHETIWGLFDILADRDKVYQVLAVGLLYQMVGLIFKYGHYQANSLLNSNHTRRKIRNFKKVLLHIQEAYDTPIALQDLAGIAQMSPKYFCKYFKNMMGKSPIEYLNFYRIENAAHKLCNSDASVTDIAYSCGFNDLSYFIKTFKRYKNATPRQFRNQMSKTLPNQSFTFYTNS